MTKPTERPGNAVGGAGGDIQCTATMCAHFIPKGKLSPMFHPSAFSSKSARHVSCPRRLAPSSCSLAEHDVEESPVAVQGTAPLAECKSSPYMFCCWLRRKLPVDVVAKSFCHSAACCCASTLALTTSQDFDHSPP